MEENKNFLSSNIKFLRIQKNITQRQIGDFCNKSDVAISYWENDKREPSIAHLILIADALCISLDELVGRGRR